MKNNLYWSFTFILLFFYACDSDRLQKILDYSGENRTELESALKNFENDTLKYQATCFLIENMSGKHFCFGEGVDDFYTYIDSVYCIYQEEYDIPHIYMYYKENVYSSQEPIYVAEDIKNITSEYLIQTVERAFDVWNRPWNTHLSVEEFYEWILPYKLEDEIPEDWWTLYREKFGTLLSDTVKTAKEACRIINDRIKELPIHIALETVRPSAIRPSSLINIKFGLCEDYANLAVYAMRSVGIPVGIETVPHWGNTNNRHTFNVVYDNDGGYYDFSGGEDNPGEHLNRFSHKIPKVYRNRYSVHPGSLAMRCGKEQVPSFFRSPFMEDVTANYPFIGAKDIVLPAIKETKDRFAYLCVFDPQGWIPVAWAERNGDSLRFKSVGPDIVYHLAYYEKDALVLSGHPFLLDASGHITHFIPTDEKRSMELYRKNPESENLKSIPGRVKGGRFQGADNPRFQGAEDLHVIADEPPFKYVGVSVESSRPYKYYRYLTSDECNGNMAEVEFYASGSDEPLQGKVIGDYEPSIYYPRNTADRMFDGDALTFFHTNNMPCWGGLELERAERVDSIRFIIRNDDNGVRKGNLYELFCMSDGRWVSLGRQTATEDDRIVFGDVPAGALYWLRNLTRGREERIFTYEDGKQVWW